MVTLRDIFIELGSIFDFHYEQNFNASYRVNTVIRSLVYPELYLSRSYNPNDICYFLANPDFSYQNYPNIRNSFSELMKPKDTSNRYPIISFLDSIDIKRMYDYYDILIGSDSASGRKELVHDFLERIFADNAVFHAKLRLICSNDNEYLTWLIIFSMFNSELACSKFDSFVQEKTHTADTPTINESDARHKISAILHIRKDKLTGITALSFVLSALQMFLALVPYLISHKNSLYSTLSSSSFCVALLSLSLIVLVIRTRQSKLAHEYSDLQTYHDYMGKIPDAQLNAQLQAGDFNIILKPFNNTSQSNVGRNQVRTRLKLLLFIMLPLSIVASFLFASFPILLAFISVSLIIIMFADRYVNDSFFRIFYDRLFVKNGEKPSSWRGLARIYQTEYAKTHFDKNDPYYKTNVHVHSSSCYKHIFLLAYERTHYYLFIVTFVFIYFNIVFLIIEVLNMFFSNAVLDYLRVSNVLQLNIVVSIYLIAIGLYNITTLITANTSYSHLSKLAYASSSAESYPKWAEEFFLYAYSRGIIHDVDWMRGIFSYDTAHFEKGKTIESIFPESDRMQFFHRHVMFRSVSLITVSLAYIAVFSILVWQLKLYYLAAPITLFCILLYLYLYKRGLYNFMKHRIITEINALSEADELNPLALKQQSEL